MAPLQTPDRVRPPASRSDTAPPVTTNSHFAGMAGGSSPSDYQYGLQIIDEDQTFNQHLSRYLSLENVGAAGFNYHLISVFGSQSTGKSTLLNTLFGTNFGVMSEAERRQTTKGIWMSKNKNTASETMAENILVMDVEGTDGRERGEDQDFERKSALFALATSEVLIVNIWEHQVGLYQGANMGLLKVVFEVNLELFLKDKDRSSSPRSLLFFVIRDFLGNTPLTNLRNTLIQDLNRIWSGLNKPVGLENSRINDYFDFAFAALPHKILQPDRFVSEVQKLGMRFREGQGDSRRKEILGEYDDTGIFLPEYHRRIPADGFSHYAEGIWDQIVNNKDLDLPTQQELLAQFRCDEIMREVLVKFDEMVTPAEQKQISDIASGNPQIITGLGDLMRTSRLKILTDFDHDAGRYHKAVFTRKKIELVDKIDSRLKLLFQGQLSAAHKVGISSFSNAVMSSVKEGQKKGSNYDFGGLVDTLKQKAVQDFKEIAKGIMLDDVPWSDPKPELNLFQKDLEVVTAQLRKDEMRRLATRSERWVRSRLNDSIGLQFSALGSGRAGSGAPEKGSQLPEQDVWDRIWSILLDTVSEAESKFSERAKSFDATLEEVEVGLWRLRRKSWKALRDKIDEEMLDGNLLLKLRENFEDKFRYDEHGVPRIWRPTDDVEGIYTRARESTLVLIPLLSRFRLQGTLAPPPLEGWIGRMPLSATATDEEDLVPIGGVDEDEGKSLEEEMIILNDTKRQDITIRFKKTADGVYVEAKRSAIGSMTQVPLYFYGLLLALGWNEIIAVLRNPIYFLFLILVGISAYFTYTLNLWGPIIKMANAASQQAVEEGKRRLREFLETTDTGQQAIDVSSNAGRPSRMNRANTDPSGKGEEEDDAVIDI